MKHAARLLRSLAHLPGNSRLKRALISFGAGSALDKDRLEKASGSLMDSARERDSHARTTAALKDVFRGADRLDSLNDKDWNHAE